jgi:S-formylglutathione hydrolase FrmB
MQQYRYNFWTPRGADGRLPVLYLLHGAGVTDDESSWLKSSMGNVADVIGPIVQSKLIFPLAVVTPFGRPANVKTMGQPLFPELEGFHAYLMALIREVESDPRLQVRPERAGRAIAGLSMGAWQTIGAFLRSPDMFSPLGNFSGAVDVSFGRTFDRPLRAHQLRPLTVFYHTCGKQDQVFYEQNREFVKELNAAGVPNIPDFPDGGRDWPFWQGAVGRFAKHLGAASWGI